MEEKILVKSQQYNAKKIFRVVGCVALLIVVLAIMSAFSNAYEEAVRWEAENPLETALRTCLTSWGIGATEIVLFSLAGLFLIIDCVSYFWLKSYELVVTDKRTYGKVAFGKRVDLPNDSISAISMVPMFKGVAVATSSGKISFLLIKNADEVYDAVNKLLMARQEKKAEPVVVATPAVSNAGELKQYKELLDSGAISQEEYDAKKKQLLGL